MVPATPGSPVLRSARRFATLSVVTVLLGLGVVGSDGESAGAGPVLAAEEAEWTTESVPGSELHFDHPSTWFVAPADLLAQMTAALGITAVGGDGLIAVIDPGGANDNLVVNRYAGELATWYSSYDEWKQVGRVSAKSSGGKLLATGRGRLGGLPMYWESERDPGGAGEPAVIFTEIEVRESKDSVVTFALSISEDTPGARALARRFVKGISAN